MSLPKLEHVKLVQRKRNIDGRQCEAEKRQKLCPGAEIDIQHARGIEVRLEAPWWRAFYEPSPYVNDYG